MKITYDATVDATNIYVASGTYHTSVPLELEGVDFILDIDEGGRVLKLEVLAVSQLFDLIGRQGRQLVVPERIENPDTFDVLEMFPKAPAHA
jgi:uncharacterized protein YuzE